MFSIYPSSQNYFRDSTAEFVYNPLAQCPLRMLRMFGFSGKDLLEGGETAAGAFGTVRAIAAIEFFSQSNPIIGIKDVVVEKFIL